MSEYEFEKAKRQAAEERSFWKHLISYIVVISFLFFVNLFSSPGKWWVQWPALGWGIGLVFHGVKALGRYGVFSEDWEERRAKEIMNKNGDRES